MVEKIRELKENHYDENEINELQNENRRLLEELDDEVFLHN